MRFLIDDALLMINGFLVGQIIDKLRLIVASFEKSMHKKGLL